MVENKFKVGDKVKVAFSNNSEMIGRIGVYKGRSEFGFYIVELDEGDYNFIRQENLELVEDQSPILTVTRREIVPGVFGRLDIQQVYDGELHFGLTHQNLGRATFIAGCSVGELKSIIKTLQSIVEVMEENDA